MKALSTQLLLALPLIVGAGPSHAGTWYFCDPLRAYYPTVRTCPAPWHPVEAPNPGPVPPQAQAARPAQSNAGYQDGLKAREDWWTWRASLEGSYRDGVDYWSAHRNLAQPGTCDEPVGATATDPTWTQGCEDAKQRLVAVDAKMKAEPNFWRGWVAFKPSPEAIQAARKAAAQPSPDAGIDPVQEGPAPDAASPNAAPPDAAPPAGSAPAPEGVPPAQNGY